jgi:hypothetical protein
MIATSRRGFLAGGAAWALGASLGRLARAQSEPMADVEGGDLVTRATLGAIERGLGYLAKRQNEDGSLGSGGQTVSSRNVAICGLGGLAFLSSGSTPGRGPYGAEVSGCLKYILANTQDSGFIISPGTASHGPMYGHGFATLFLAEVYGMTPDSSVHEKLGKAVKLIIDTQNDEGGWRYQPQRSEADISVTVCQIMALRAARNAGIYVPNDTVERCVDYVKRSQNADGGFMYMIHGGPSAFPRSAAGVVALYSAGIYEGEEIQRGLEYLMQHVPQSQVVGRESNYFYGHYYAVQAMWHAGGKLWQQWYPAIRDTLLERQLEGGEWNDNEVGPEYSTAMASIILQLPVSYLPILQR